MILKRSGLFVWSRSSLIKYCFQLYLGSYRITNRGLLSPPMFTEMRVLRQCPDDDHLVLELGMNFRTAHDMSAILAVKLRKRLGFGMWAKLHLLGMHVEGKLEMEIEYMVSCIDLNLCL